MRQKMSTLCQTYGLPCNTDYHHRIEGNIEENKQVRTALGVMIKCDRPIWEHKNALNFKCIHLVRCEPLNLELLCLISLNSRLFHIQQWKTIVKFEVYYSKMRQLGIPSKVFGTRLICPVKLRFVCYRCREVKREAFLDQKKPWQTPNSENITNLTNGKDVFLCNNCEKLSQNASTQTVC